jgi:predicted nucleic acid-binding protein
MIRRVLVDTDIILDVALAREPFLQASKMALTILENNIAIGHVTSNCIANLYYILRKTGGDKNARFFILKILKYLTVITTDHSVIIDSLKSGFKDFEDAMQNFSAAKNQCEFIITRNIEDYKESKLTVYLPIEFIETYS